MADGSPLGDLLAGAAGAPVNRPALNAYVTQGQAMAGLRTAQTEDALARAQQMREEMDAGDQLEGALTSAGMQPSAAKSAALMMKGKFGNSQQALDAIKLMQEIGFRHTLGDPAQLGTPAATAAQQGVQGKAAEPVTVPNEYTVQPGMPQPTVQQTPLGASETAEHNAKAAAANGAAADPQAISYASYQLYKTGKMPPMGMGGGPARMAILHGAAGLAQREANGEDVSNPGFDQAIANGQDYVGAQRAINSAAGGPIGNQARAINNTVGHLRLFEDTYTALQNGDTKFLNSVSNKWKTEFGTSGAPTTLQAMAEVIGPEMTKILTNTNAGTAEERAAFSRQAGSIANSPEVMAEAIHGLRGMFARQAVDLAFQYHGATGRNDFAKRYLQPDVVKDLELEQNAAAPPGATPGTNRPALASFERPQ